MKRKCSVNVHVKKLYFINCGENEEKKADCFKTMYPAKCLYS